MFEFIWILLGVVFVIMLIDSIITSIKSFRQRLSQGDGVSGWVSNEASQVEHADNSSDVAELYRIAGRLQEFFSSTAHPKDVLTAKDFVRGVKLLC